ncbi:hypothetical protein CONPUDRAFT_151679 [Coniophora puteana RWD-64-598 SS2]|uniref:Uncharacterized protein n=1 Tax=Coniophora puteana (strain RWD-64-598) TaxID=741705 RepID=A0A5M3MU25_CONPW|nr:uncharacterized protein CONPUDRAFT_151679 [Coniophora puteana RWD-64-598 SS2]EIW82606.1 hypothetical protein CONPUDRAFT_151679 [Coniophora puteana RWD-64-598 SS2]
MLPAIAPTTPIPAVPKMPATLELDSTRSAAPLKLLACGVGRLEREPPSVRVAPLGYETGYGRDQLSRVREGYARQWLVSDRCTGKRGLRTGRFRPWTGPPQAVV